ncbi:MAG TPA: lysylphosphatidylglycerol synthase transmembrane domain-containing protein [Ktedonobacteraceae bacterium]|nr:lysylphosphatidylglycerol synthase transmembrane domain-containing protein [Ktedonobacteraceae bacterium]
MQFDPDELPPPIRPRPARPRLVGMEQNQASPYNTPVTPQSANRTTSDDVSAQPTSALDSMQLGHTPPAQSVPKLPPLRPRPERPAFFMPDTADISTQSTQHLMQLSGMMRAVKVPTQNSEGPVSPLPTMPMTNDFEDGYWPYGIQQTGALPVVNLYGREPFGRTLPLAAVSAGAAVPLTPPIAAKPRSAWRAALGSPVVKVVVGLLIGVGLLFLVAHFVDLPATIAILRQNLTTPRGIIFALLSGVAFLIAFSIRGVRWKLFINPIGKISTFKAIQLFLVGIFLNFLLPIRGGEVAKSLMLKRIADIPISKSLPTVAMDKALDLMPALFIMAIVPLLGVKMDIKLWIVLALVGGLLIGLIFFIALAAWKRDAAIHLLQRLTGILPKSIGSKIEGFATGFVDSLLAGASQPRIFIPAVLLTVVAVIFDGLFAMLAFWTVGFPISFGTAIFGYTVYNMFYILPTPPGQVGSNEAIGLLVFSGLLHLPADKVTAMFVFSHPYAALIMTITGMACLSALGLKLSSAMKVQTGNEGALETQEKTVQHAPARV